MANKVFLNFARKDRGFARQISSILLEEGFEIWSNAKIQSDENSDEALREAIEAADVFVVLISENFNQSANAIFELGAGYAFGKKMIAISIHGEISELPWMLKNHPILDGRSLQKEVLLQVVSEETVRVAA